MAFYCQDCRSSFVNSIGLIAHRIPSLAIGCEVSNCGRVSKSKCDYQQHKETHRVTNKGESLFIEPLTAVNIPTTTVPAEQRDHGFSFPEKLLSATTVQDPHQSKIKRPPLSGNAVQPGATIGTDEILQFAATWQEPPQLQDHDTVRSDNIDRSITKPRTQESDRSACTSTSAYQDPPRPETSISAASTTVFQPAPTSNTQATSGTAMARHDRPQANVKSAAASNSIGIAQRSDIQEASQPATDRQIPPEVNASVLASPTSIDQTVTSPSNGENANPSTEAQRLPREVLAEKHVNVAAKPQPTGAQVSGDSLKSSIPQTSTKENDPHNQGRKKPDNEIETISSLDSIPFRYDYRSRTSSSGSDTTLRTVIPKTVRTRERQDTPPSVWDTSSHGHSRSINRIKPTCKTCELRFGTEETLRDHQKAEEHCFCTVCSSFFLNEGERRKHDLSAHSFQCQACDAIFPNILGLSNHQVQTQHCFCTSCQIFFGSAEATKSHKSTHRTFMCLETTCNTKFDREELLQAHQKASNHLYCKACDRHFEDMQSATTHLQSDHSLRCPAFFCQVLFASNDLLLKHQLKTGHSYCNACRLLFQSQAAWTIHQKQKHGKRCPTCNVSFKNAKETEAHQITSKHCICESCSLVFGSHKVFDSHFKQVHGFVCPDSCGQGFQNDVQLQDHQKQSGHCYCATCRKFFSSTLAYNSHKTNAHYFFCDAPGCRRYFPTVTGFDSHRKDKSHLYCSKCNFYFNRESDFQEHDRDAHANKNPAGYECKPCRYTYGSNKAKMERHLDQYHGRDAYCSTCGTNFSNPTLLATHWTIFPSHWHRR